MQLLLCEKIAYFSLAVKRFSFICFFIQIHQWDIRYLRYHNCVWHFAGRHIWKVNLLFSLYLDCRTLFEICLNMRQYLPASLHISKEWIRPVYSSPLSLFLKQYAWRTITWKIVKPRFVKKWRHDGMDGQRAAHSMIGPRTYDQLQKQMKTVVRENIEGAFLFENRVVWRGGSMQLFMNGVFTRQTTYES